MKALYVLTLSFTCLIFQGCSTQKAQTLTKNTPAALSYEAFTQLAQSQALEPHAFRNDTFYELIVAELANDRKNYTKTIENYSRQAHLTKDIGIIKYAAKVAQHFQKHEHSIDIALLWLEKEPNNVEAHSILINAYIQTKQLVTATQSAEQLLTSSINRKTIDEQAIDRKVAVFETIAQRSRHITTDEKQQLIDLYLTLIDKYPRFPAIKVGLSRIYQYMNSNKIAYQWVTKALSQNLTYLPAILQEINLLESNQEKEKAVKQLEKYLAIDPDNVQVRLNYARLLAQTDIQKAYDEFTFLSENAPESPQLILPRAMLALELNQLDIAKQLFKRLENSNHRQNLVYFYLGNLAEIDNQTDQAINYYKRITGGEDFVHAHSKAGLLMAQQDQWPAVHAHFSQLRANTEKPSIKSRLYLAEAEILHQFDYKQKAIELLGTAIEEYPEDTDLRYKRASVYEQQKQLDLMEQDLQYVLNLEPQNASALNALGYFLTIHTERYQEAKLLIEQALTLRPEEPAIIDSMGWVLFKLGNHQQALHYLRKAFKQFPDPEIAAHLGEVLWVTGKKQEAELIWATRLKENPNDEKILETMERLKAKTSD